jgi:nucleotide-binding universal stress UspA family protein
VFDPVLVPVADPPAFGRAFPHARHLSERLEAPLTVLTVVGDARERDTASAMLDDLVGAEPGARAAAAVRVGDPADEVATEVAASPDPLVVMSTRAARPLQEFVFGSVAAQVLQTGRPTLLVGPGCDEDRREAPRLDRLLVCLDDSAVSAAILPLVRRLAGALELFVMLCYVGYPVVDVSSGEPVFSREDREVEAELAEHARELHRLGIDAAYRAVPGTWPAEAIVEHARHRMADGIALATHGRSGLARVLSGSTTAEVVRRASTPVLTLRPAELLH